jgi:hypothetical protein
MAIRRQATLYLSTPSSTAVESIRSRFNRAQFDMIRAHVTLCREDEVCNWDDFASRLIAMDAIEVALEFGMPVRDKDLVYLPATGSSESFDKLRYSLLTAQGTLPRNHNPHITLVHPRNGTCSDCMFDEIASRCRPFSSTFRRVSLIEQVDCGRWQDLKTFE